MSKHRYLSKYGLWYIQVWEQNLRVAGKRPYRGHSSSLIWLKVEPQFDNLRDDPRFIVLINKMHFE